MLDRDLLVDVELDCLAMIALLCSGTITVDPRSLPVRDSAGTSVEVIGSKFESNVAIIYSK